MAPNSKDQWHLFFPCRCAELECPKCRQYHHSASGVCPNACEHCQQIGHAKQNCPYFQSCGECGKNHYTAACPSKVWFDSVKFGDYTKVHTLLLDSRRKSNINEEDKRGCNAYFYACLNGHVNVVELLSENGSSLSFPSVVKEEERRRCKDTQVRALNNLRVKAEAARAVQACSSRRDNYNWDDKLKNTPLLRSWTDLSNGKTLLHYACQNGRLDVARLLLKYDPSLLSTHQGACDRTPLHLAAEQGAKELVGFLLGLSFVYVDGETLCGRGDLDPDEGGTVVQFSRSLVPEHVTAVYILTRSSKAKCIEVPEGFQAIIPTPKSYRLEFSFGLPPKVFSPWRTLVLRKKNIAICYGNNNDADVNATTKSFMTPLHDAARNGSIPVIHLLLLSGAELDAQDSSGNTPLMIALDRLNFQAAELLTSYGANIYLKNNLDQTCHDILQVKGPSGRAGIALLDQIDRDFRDQQKMKPYLEEILKWSQKSQIRKSIYQHLSGSQTDKIQIELVEEQGEAAKVLNRIREGRYNIMTEAFFSPPNGDQYFHSSLYVSLAYASSKYCTSRDVSEALVKYEEKMAKAQSEEKVVNALYLLACARLADLNSKRDELPLLSLALLHFFRVLCGDEWLTERERNQLDSPKDDEKSEQSASPMDDLKKKWKKISEQLTREQKKPMEELLQLVGLESVKRKALEIYSSVLAKKKMKEKNFTKAVVDRTLNFAFMGNPGTGKTTVALLFARLLEQAGARAGHKFVQMTGCEALRKGAQKVADEIATLTGGRAGVSPPPEKLRKGMRVEILSSDNKWYPGKILEVPSQNIPGYRVEFSDGTEESNVTEDKIRPTAGSSQPVGGVLFIDEAYDLNPSGNPVGQAIMAEIMSVAEEHRDKVTIILAGYKDDIENKLYAHNTGMASRFESIMFEDFTDAQLYQIWKKMCEERTWTCSEDVSLVASRRLARGIGQKGFGNARAVRNLFESVIAHAEQDYLNSPENPPEILMEHVIGKEPSRATNPELDEALKELEGLTGLRAVKKAIFDIVQLAHNNYFHELRGEHVDAILMNRLFLGNPGTGKTTVCLIYGRVLKALRLLSNGDIVYKTASDFMGQYVGESGQKTKSIVEMAKGKVLMIDEAYVLDDKLYGKQALDTIVEKVSGNVGEDLAVVMCGYEPPMLKMLRDQNPGLSRRFDPAYALHFEDFSDEELLAVLSYECTKGRITMPIDIKLHLVRQLSKRRALPNFGNAGAIKVMLADTKRKMVARCQAEGKMDNQEVILADIGEGEPNDPMRVLEELADLGDFKQKLEDLGRRIAVRTREGRSTTGLVGHYIFTGSPGTGKTTVAMKMGYILHAYGVLATDHVEVTSALDLRGQYVGSTTQVVQQKLEAARGGVLFIDEAYELVLDVYGKEAVTKLVSMLTEPEYMNSKTIVIMAGYHKQMHEMLATNPGLKSRFTESLHFPDLDSEKATNLVLKMLADSQPRPYTLQDPDAVTAALTQGFKEAIRRPGWANMRDVNRIVKDIEAKREERLGRDLENPIIERTLTILPVDVDCAMQEFLESRPAKIAPVRIRMDLPLNSQSASNYYQPHQHQENDVHEEDEHQVHEVSEEEEKESEGTSELRIDETLTQLKELLKTTDDAHAKGIEAEMKRLKELQEQLAKLEAEKKRLEEEAKKAEEERKRIEEERRVAAEKEAERLRQLEEKARLAREEEARRLAEELRKMKKEAERRRKEEEERLRKLLEEQRKREEEARRRQAELDRIRAEELKRQQIQEKLRKVGNCPAGFSWIQTGTGWRCAGGSHYVSNIDLL